MKQKTWQFYYFATKDPRMPEKWVLLRKLGKEILSQEAQQKFEWIIFYYALGKEEKTIWQNCYKTTKICTEISNTKIKLI